MAIQLVQPPRCDKTRFAVVLAAFLVAALPTPAPDPPLVVRVDIEWLDVWVPGYNTKNQPVSCPQEVILLAIASSAVWREGKVDLVTPRYAQLAFTWELGTIGFG